MIQNTDSQEKKQEAATYVAAIDIGTTKIVAMAGKRTGKDKIEVLDFCKAASQGIRRGEVLNLNDASQVIQQVVSTLQQRINMKISHVFVGVAGQHIEMISTRSYINRTVPEEKITAAEVENLKKDAYNYGLPAGKEIIHVIPQSYIVDDNLDITNPVGMIGKRLEGNFSVIVGSIDSLQRIKRCVEDASLHIEEIILEPLASSDAVLFPREKNTGVALVDIGGGTTDVAIFYDDILRHSAVIPFGGTVISEDIRKVVGLTFEEAEKLKIEFGMALPDGESENNIIVIPCEIPGQSEKELSVKHLIGIIQARMEEIIDQVVFHIEQSGYGNLLGSGIVITGGGALLRHLAQLVSYKTGQSVRIGYPGQFLASDAEKVNEPLFATAVGLLMQGLQYMDAHPASKSYAPSDIRQTPRPAPRPTPVPPPVTETVFQPAERSNDDIDNGFGETETESHFSVRPQEKAQDGNPKNGGVLNSFFSKISTFFEEKDVDENDRM